MLGILNQREHKATKGGRKGIMCFSICDQHKKWHNTQKIYCFNKDFSPMSANNIEIQIFGQVLRLYCPPEQQANLLASAQRLEERVATLKEQSGIIQLEKVLAIVALNLNYELELEKQKNESHKNVLENCIQQLDSSLNKLLATGAISVDSSPKG